MKLQIAASASLYIVFQYCLNYIYDVIKQINNMKNQIKLGKKVTWNTSFHDGRSYELIKHTGVITKVNRVTVDVFDENKQIIRINKLKLQ